MFLSFVLLWCFSPVYDDSYGLLTIFFSIAIMVWCLSRRRSEWFSPIIQIAREIHSILFPLETIWLLKCFFKCHGSTAFILYVEFCKDCLIRICDRAKWKFNQIGITIAKNVVKWIPVILLCWLWWTLSFYLEQADEWLCIGSKVSTCWLEWHTAKCLAVNQQFLFANYIYQYNTSPRILILLAPSHYLKQCWTVVKMSSVKWWQFCLSLNVLTHWDWDKMATVSQLTFSNAFSWMKMYEFLSKFQWNLFRIIQLTIFQCWLK